MRNESLRLPYFISYYKSLGVDRFFFIDNDSHDLSREIVLQEPRAHLFTTSDSYKNHWFWMEHLLEKYGRGHWCFVVDIDEIFTYPFSETIPLRSFIRFLQDTSCTAVRSFLLDMYANDEIQSIKYLPGQNPLEVLPYFDRGFTKISFSFFDRKNWMPFDALTYIGGVRERVFGTNLPNHLSKISLCYFGPKTYLTQGMHAINNAKVSTTGGSTFHTKFLQDFLDEVKEESVREQHFGNAVLYKIFDQHLGTNSSIFFNHKSEKYFNTEQLVQLNMIPVSQEFYDYFGLPSKT